MSKIKSFYTIFILTIFLLLSTSVSSQEFNDLELIGKQKPNLLGNHFKLREEAYNAFLEMKKAALKEGVHIKIVSSYRSYKHQNSIWKRKYNRYISRGLSPKTAIKKIIEYSTIPGTSRHHWGTDIDIIDGNYKIPKNVLVERNYQKNGVYNKLKKWMDANANKYGFYLVYTNDENRKGFHYEPWHYSYSNLSKPILHQFLKLDLKAQLQSQKLMGSAYFSEDFLELYITKFILGINSELL